VSLNDAGDVAFAGTLSSGYKGLWAGWHNGTLHHITPNRPHNFSRAVIINNQAQVIAQDEAIPPRPSCAPGTPPRSMPTTSSPPASRLGRRFRHRL
jgi:hypothetical protein